MKSIEGGPNPHEQAMAGIKAIEEARKKKKEVAPQESKEKPWKPYGEQMIDEALADIEATLGADKAAMREAVRERVENGGAEEDVIEIEGEDDLNKIIERGSKKKKYENIKSETVQKALDVLHSEEDFKDITAEEIENIFDRRAMKILKTREGEEMLEVYQQIDKWEEQLKGGGKKLDSDGIKFVSDQLKDRVVNWVKQEEKEKVEA
ncbi:MAG: hypothetical protein OEV93_04780 [Candidatus Moranbacteria bacterium]|nr:hypothetical protein [Candidatus Moranbacteria bacterium]